MPYYIRLVISINKKHIIDLLVFYAVSAAASHTAAAIIKKISVLKYPCRPSKASSSSGKQYFVCKDGVTLDTEHNLTSHTTDIKIQEDMYYVICIKTCKSKKPLNLIEL